MVPTLQHSHQKRQGHQGLGADRATANTLSEMLACDDEQFVYCAYRTLLGRDPDPEGLGNYLEQLRTGAPKRQLLADLRLSPEGVERSVEIPGLLDSIATINATRPDTPNSPLRTCEQLLALHDGEFVRQAYVKLLGREPDQSGYSIYVERLRAGASKAGILALFRGCAEAKERDGHLLQWAVAAEQKANAGDRQDIAGVPAGGDPAANVECATCTISDLLHLDAAAFVGMLFRNVLGRQPDAHAAAFYQEKLADGISRIQVLADIWRSEEAAAARLFRHDVDTAVRRYRWGRIPVFGRLVRWIADIESESGQERLLRRLENRLYLVNQEVARLQAPVASPELVWEAPGSATVVLPVAANTGGDLEAEQMEEFADDKRTLAKPVKYSSGSLRSLPIKSDRKNEI